MTAGFCITQRSGQYSPGNGGSPRDRAGRPAIAGRPRPRCLGPARRGGPPPRKRWRRAATAGSHPPTACRRRWPPQGTAGGRPSNCPARAKGDRGPGVSPRETLRATAKSAKGRQAKSDAGWLRGQTTRRRIHRRSDGGPERRQVLRRGTRAPYACYTETPPCASRPDYRMQRVGGVSV